MNGCSSSSGFFRNSKTLRGWCCSFSLSFPWVVMARGDQLSKAPRAEPPFFGTLLRLG